jgi:tetratricopeptide (TPR) repeat protein
MRIAIIVLVALAPLATDAAPPAQAKEEARAAYLKARAHYDGGRYAEAVVELKRAYSLQKFSVLLRYIADSYYAMRKYKLALDYYRSYLQRARHAPDKVEVGLRVRELEDSLSGDETGPVSAGTRAKLPPHLVPDGRDREEPTELHPAPATQPSVESTPISRQASARHKAFVVAKWSALGVGVAAFAVGLTYNLLARSKARDLEQAVREACPEESPGCRGNPFLDRPVAMFSPEQYDLELTVERYQNRSIAFFAVAGVAAATSVVLFILDRPRPERPAEPRVSVIPALGPGHYGLFAEARFR